MGRRLLFNFKKYVSIDNNGNSTKCLLCNKVLRGIRAGNIKRHYELIHNITITDNEKMPQTSSHCAIKKKNSDVQISMSKNEFLICCVGLVTVKNLPFRIFDDDKYFKKIIRPYEDLHKTSINSRNIISKINISAIKIKENISKLVFKKMVSLKIDVATHMGKSILGINIQYIKDSKININTIGMVQLQKTHTAQFLREEILKCLKEYNIDISQVYACTSDNGANIIKTAKLLQDLQEEATTEEVEHLSSSDDDYFENIHTSLSSVMSVFRCAAHTIQLAARDVLETIQSEIEECRKVVKSLRAHIRYENPSYFQMLIIDNITCWYSTFKMIQSLKNFKEYFEIINDFNAPDPNWDFIAKFLSAFQPLSDCTNKFQSEQYIIGDFYRDWLCCEIELEELSSQENIFAHNLLNAMTQRKQNLLTNEAFISAIYLDPRFNFIKTPFLSEEHKEIALKHLLKTHLMIKRLADQNTNVQTPPTLSSSSLHTKQFEKLEAKMNLSIQQIPPTDQSMKHKLETLCNVERASFEANILEYYNISDPELANIFDVALSVPSTQVSVERAFSALSTILTKSRSKLSNETINNLLLIKLNKNLIENIIIADDI